MVIEKTEHTTEALKQMAERLAQTYLGVSAEEAYRMIDDENPTVFGTILEIELNNIRWLLSQ